MQKEFETKWVLYTVIEHPTGSKIIIFLNDIYTWNWKEQILFTSSPHPFSKQICRGIMLIIELSRTYTKVQLSNYGKHNYILHEDDRMISRN